VKILFVDDSSNLQEKWIEPLRGEGWGVVRARSTEDAEKIFEFHGDSLSALVVSEACTEWAEKWNYPYVVFLKTWKENQVVKHQNTSNHPANAYLDFDSNLELVKQAIMDAQGKAKILSLKSTGTDGVDSTEVFQGIQPTSSIISALESISSSSSSESSSADDSSEGIVISFDKYAEEKAEIENTSKQKAVPEVEVTASEPQDTDRTMMLDTSTMEVLSPVAAEAPVEEVSSVEDVVQVLETEEAPAENTIKFTLQNDEIDLIESSDDGQDEVEEFSEIESPSISYTPNYTPSSAGSKDVETMKNYLALREQDVALLTGQMRSAQERVQHLETQLKLEKARSGELQQMVQKQEQQIRNFDRDKQVEFEVLFQQVEDLNLQLRERTDKVRTIEARLKITTDEVEKVKERVRVDIRRIRVREKELESQLEILKKDSTALLVARDEKIIELKRKIDLLEFNMELVQEQYGKERNITEQLRHKLKEAAGVMKRAGGLLDHEN